MLNQAIYRKKQPLSPHLLEILFDFGFYVFLKKVTTEIYPVRSLVKFKYS